MSKVDTTAHVQPCYVTETNVICYSVCGRGVHRYFIRIDVLSLGVYLSRLLILMAVSDVFHIHSVTSTDFTNENVIGICGT